MTTVVVAGGTGDLGTRIVRQLEAADVEVRVLARTGSAARDHVGTGSEVVEADYADAEGLRRAVLGPTSSSPP